MKASKGKGLLLALVLWGSLLPAAWAAGTGTTEYGMGAESLAAAGPALSGKLAVSQPLGETGALRQKDLKAELLARYGERKKRQPVVFRDPKNDVHFALPDGFSLQGVYGRGKNQEDILMRASRGDTLLVYMANGAMMKTEGQKEAKPFQSEKVMLELTARTYEEEARNRGVPVQVSEMGTFAGRDGLHIRSWKKGRYRTGISSGTGKNCTASAS